ncbi:hypothetical protein CTAYLR_010686 [Chrysophaeum taylorii]|uniref:RRM domain-containing protein n=1 Tax=Chrysophaeum taylorii TaxID=2483200 RepID=A0AAD7UA54_9STRA|nr:hypothetical protein CTAYLR_010686 [Chrysophaeum taylorii]
MEEGGFSAVVVVEQHQENEEEEEEEKEEKFETTSTEAPGAVVIPRKEDEDPEVRGVPAASHVTPGSYKWAVRLRGLPWACSAKDVGHFLLGASLPEERVVFVHNVAGDGFARLVGDEEYEKALSKHGKSMTSATTNSTKATIEVFEASGEEADDWAKRCSKRPTGSYRGVVKLKGLPYSSTEDDIASTFFSGEIDASRVHVLLGGDGRATGQAYAEFRSTRRARNAIARYDKKELGGRWIDLIEATRGELYSAQHASATALRSLASNDGGLGVVPSSDVGILRVRGLLFEATREDVAEFFSGYAGVDESSVFMASRSADGRPSGEAFVCFASPADAQRARLEKNGEELGGRWLELYASTTAELGARCKAALRAAARSDAADAAIVRLRGLPFQATLADVERLVAAASDASRGAFRLRSPVELAVFLTSDDARRPTGEAFAVLDGDRPQAEKAVRGLTGATLGDRVVAAVPAAKAELYAALGEHALSSRCLALRGLSYSCASPHDLERKFFSLPGIDVEAVFLCRDRSKNTTGLAYALVADDDSTINALARNRADLDGRFIEVFPCSREEFDREKLGNDSGLKPPPQQQQHHHHHRPTRPAGYASAPNYMPPPRGVYPPAGGGAGGGAPTASLPPRPDFAPPRARRPDYYQQRR